MVYALDTNIIIHINLQTKTVLANRNKAVRQGAQIVVPPFVHYEISRHLFVKPVSKYVTAYRNMLENCDIGKMTTSMWLRAAKIYAELKSKSLTVNDADIIIAAFCIESGHILVTNNTKDFANISHLNMVDWVKTP